MMRGPLKPWTGSSVLSCVYAIIHRESGKIYVGKTKNLPVRMAGHRSVALNSKVKGCPKLGSAIRKHGCDSFDVEILKECNPSDLEKWELFYIRFFQSINTGYNVSERSLGREFGYVFPESAKRKISQKNSGRKQNLSSAERDRRRGYKHTKATLDKLRNISLNRRHSIESIEKMRDSSVLKKTVWQFRDGVFISEFPSISGASRSTGVDASKICKVLRGHRKTAGGFTWKYKN